MDRRYEIWTEGFSATGESGTAMLLGTANGLTFREACIELAKKDQEFASYFNGKDLTYWGCRLFDNEVDARKSFG